MMSSLESLAISVFVSMLAFLSILLSIIIIEIILIINGARFIVVVIYCVEDGPRLTKHQICFTMCFYLLLTGYYIVVMDSILNLGLL